MLNTLKIHKYAKRERTLLKCTKNFKANYHAQNEPTLEKCNHMQKTIMIKVRHLTESEGQIKYL